MFFTLVGKTIIKQITSPRDYLTIFLIGIVGYVILHWYLHVEKRNGVVEKIREYLYYAMVIDAIVAYFVLKYAPINKQADDSKEQNDEKEVEYTPEQKLFLIQKMREARLQQLKLDEKVKSENNVDENIIQNEQKNDIMDSPNDKKNIFVKNDDSNSIDSKKQNTNNLSANVTKDVSVDAEECNNGVCKVKDNKSVLLTDTDIPIYKKSDDAKNVSIE